MTRYATVLWISLSACRNPCETLWFEDFDGDGFGNPDVSERACEPPVGFVHDGRDCDDEASGRNPDASDACNGVDDDCDGEIDPLGDPWYPDADGDRWGNGDLVLVTCEAPAGFTDRPGDCDDTVAAVHPQATEQCNDRDDDCDQAIDEGAPADRVYFQDYDYDGYGNPYSGVVRCQSPAGRWVREGSDCNDGDGSVHPGAPEVCNGGIDDDCDGSSDDDDPLVIGREALYHDQDRDGWGSSQVGLACWDPSDPSWVFATGDCDDFTSTVNPAAIETCAPGDEDCDGLLEVADPSLGTSGGAVVRYPDDDLDGYGGAAWAWRCAADEPGWVRLGDDCHDGDPAVGSDRWWSTDTDRDGFGAGELLAGIGCSPPLPWMPNVLRVDCDDDASAVRPTAPDACGDGLDADCTGLDRPCVDPWSGLHRVALTARGRVDTAGAAVAAGDLDHDGLTDLAFVGPTVGVSFGGPPETFDVITAEAREEGATFGSTAVVSPVATGVDALFVADGTTVRWLEFDGRTPRYGGELGSALDPILVPTGLPPDADGAVPVLVATDTFVQTWVPDHATGSGTAVNSLVRAGPGPVRSGADTDGDTIVDAAVGDPSLGVVWLYPPGVGAAGALESVAHTTVTGVPGTAFGASVAFLDWDGDGLDDLAVGAPDDDTGGVDAGAVFVFVHPTGAVDAAAATFVLVGATASDRLGTALAVTDFDGDGADDLVVGAPDAVVGSAGSGAVVGFAAGGAGIADALSADVVWYGEASAHLGARLDAADLDDVGAPDLLAADSAAVWWLPGP